MPRRDATEGEGQPLRPSRAAAGATVRGGGASASLPFGASASSPFGAPKNGASLNGKPWKLVPMLSPPG